MKNVGEFIFSITTFDSFAMFAVYLDGSVSEINELKINQMDEFPKFTAEFSSAHIIPPNAVADVKGDDSTAY